MLASRNGYLRVDQHSTTMNDLRVSLMAERINVRREIVVFCLAVRPIHGARRWRSMQIRQIAARFGLSSSCFEKRMR
jgi:hypothetical protein